MDASNQTIDAVVIGAGLVGAMVAYHLASDGRRVAVLDAQRVGQGATSRAIGLATPQLAPPALPDTLRGVDALTTLAMRLNLSPRSCRVMHLATQQAGVDALRGRAESFSGDRPRLLWETHADALPEGFTGGLVAGYSVLFDIVELTNKLLEHPRIIIRENAEVQAFEHRGARVLVLAQGYTLQCAALVLATNAYAGLLSPYLADAVQVARGYTWLSRPLGDEPDLEEQVQKAVCMPLMIDDGRMLAALGLDNRLRISAWRPTSDADADPAEDVQGFLHDRLPDLLDHIQECRSGMTVVMPDGMPLVGKLAGDGAVYYALGAGHYGPAWAPIIAERISGMLNEV
jgi:glycine/D-amino acid oxidase-like deaminating enzyme